MHAQYGQPYPKQKLQNYKRYKTNSSETHNSTGIPYLTDEQFKKFHSKLNTTEGALHFKIGKRIKNRRLKPRLPQDVLLPPEPT